MTELELLRAVRVRLASPARWTQDGWARTKSGAPCGAGDESAVCWCVSGALRIESQDAGLEALRAALCLQFQAKQLGYTNEVYLNDGADHATVLKMIDAAIETGEVAL